MREECQNLDLGLTGSYCSDDDIEISFNNLTQIDQKVGEKNFDTLFLYCTQSVNIKRKPDMIFQIIYYIIHNGKQKTPFHISLTEAIMTLVDQKLSYLIMNRLVLFISYDEMEKIDTGLAQRTINAAGVNRSPIPSTIKNDVLLHGAMDNFDHDENTPSGIGGSHDTSLMVFQNDQNKSNEKSAEISQMPENFPLNKRSLDCILPCQKLLKEGNLQDEEQYLNHLHPVKILISVC